MTIKLNEFKKCLSYVAICALVVYYSFYEFTSEYGLFPRKIANLFVLVILFFVCCLLLLNVFLPESKFRFASLAYLPFIFVLIYQTFNYECSNSYLLLYVILFLMMNFVHDFEKAWMKFLKFFKIMAIIATIGVFNQLLFPSVHLKIVNILLSSAGLESFNNLTSNGYYPGFFHQVGLTSFYICAGILYEFIFEKNKVRKLLFLILYGFVFLLQGKRSLLFIILLVLVVVYFVSGYKNQKVMRFFIILFVLLCSIVLINILTPFLEDIVLFEKLSRAFSFFAEGDIQGAVDDSGRGILYELAIKLFNENKLFGVGWGRFSDIVTTVRHEGTSVHNIYLQLLCETGIIGFSCFMLIVLCSLFSIFSNYQKLKNRRSYNENMLFDFWKFSLAGQLLFLLFGFFENPLYNENCLLFYIIMLLLNTSISKYLLNNK